MFITVRFGNDSKEIFNPDCSIVNLVLEIRKKCRVEEDSQVIDLTDETGFLMKISFAKPQESGLEYLTPLTTYILVEKRTTKTTQAQTNKKSVQKPKDLYFPLLVGVNKLLPDYCFHKTMAEKNALVKKQRAAQKLAEQSSDQKSEEKSGYQRKSMSLSSSRKSVVGYKNISRRNTTAYARRLTLM